MSLRDRLQSSNLSENSENLQGLSSSISCSARATSGASSSISKLKSSDANDLGVEDPKKVRLRAYPVSMLGAKKRCFNTALY